MTTERTFSIIKPDAVERNKIGEITAMLEAVGLRIVASKRIKLDQEKYRKSTNNYMWISILSRSCTCTSEI